MKYTGFKRFAAMLAASFVAVGSAVAHPHVWATVRTEVLFNKAGKVVAIRHHWRFDPMYSAFVTTGIAAPGKPATPQELLPLAETSIKSLVPFNYFTHAKDRQGKVAFAKPTDYSMTESEKLLTTLHFTLPLLTPASASQVFSFQVYDPTYFVDFQFAKSDPVTLVNAPKGCSLTDLKPPPLSKSDALKLSMAAAENYSLNAAIVTRLSDRAIIACP